MMRFLRLWKARARLRSIHAEVERIDHGIAQAARDLDKLLSAERRARSELFQLEHPHLFSSSPGRVYGSSHIPPRPLPPRPHLEPVPPTLVEPKASNLFELAARKNVSP